VTTEIRPIPNGLNTSLSPLLDTGICWTLDGPAPWSTWRPVLDVAIEALPVIEDELGRDIVVLLLDALVDVGEELRAVRAVNSTALAHTHDQHVEIRKLCVQQSALLDELRALLAERRTK
jgi:hypothetical protein